MTDPYVIWSFEHGAWWGPDRRGYVIDLAEAGRYSKADADAIVADANVVEVNEQAFALSTARELVRSALVAMLRRPVLVLLLLLVAAPADAQSRGLLHASLEGAFVGLQGADTTTTLLALDRGAREGNPLLRPLPPAALVAVKATGTVATIWLTRRLARDHRVAAVVLLAALNSAYAMVVTRNMRVAR